MRHWFPSSKTGQCSIQSLSVDKSWGNKLLDFAVKSFMVHIIGAQHLWVNLKHLTSQIPGLHPLMTLQWVVIDFVSTSTPSRQNSPVFCCLSPSTVKVMERMFKTGTLCYHTSSPRTCVLARVTKAGQINYQAAKRTWALSTWEQSIILSSVVFWVSVPLMLPGTGCFCDAVRPRGNGYTFPPINYSCFTWQRRSQE